MENSPSNHFRVASVHEAVVEWLSGFTGNVCHSTLQRDLLMGGAFFVAAFQDNIVQRCL